MSGRCKLPRKIPLWLSAHGVEQLPIQNTLSTGHVPATHAC